MNLYLRQIGHCYKSSFEKSTSPNARKFSNEELQDMINKALSGQLSLDSSQFSDADREKYIELLNQ